MTSEPKVYLQNPSIRLKRLLMDSVRPRLAVPFAMFGAILAVSSAAILIRFALTMATPLSIAALRLTFASLILTPYALIRYRQQLRAVPRRDLFLTSLAGIFLALHFGSWITSLEYTSVASSVVLVSTGPVWVALLSPLFLRERVSRVAFLGMLLALFGGLTIAVAGACSWDQGLSCRPLSEIVRGRALWGNFLAVVGAVALSGYLIIGRRLRQTIDLVPYVFLVYSWAAVCLLIALVASGGTLLGLPTMAYGWVLLLALVPQLVGHSTYNWALGFLPATLVAVTTLGEPIGAAIIAFFILGETPGSQVLFGAALALSGIYIVSGAANKATVSRDTG